MSRQAAVTTSPAVSGLIACISLCLWAGCAGHSGLNLPWNPAPESKLEHVTAATFDERVLKCERPVLVDFYATWCGPCTRLTPIVEQFAADHPDVRVVKVNVDDSPELAKRYGVTGMPTLLYMSGGQVVKRSVGLVPKAELEKMRQVPE